MIAMLCASCEARRARIPSSTTRDRNADLQCFQACHLPKDSRDQEARNAQAARDAQAARQPCLRQRAERLRDAGKIADASLRSLTLASIKACPAPAPAIVDYEGNEVVDCVARCPGAIISDQDCSGEDLCVDDSSTVDRVLIAVGIVGLAAAVGTTLVVGSILTSTGN